MIYIELNLVRIGNINSPEISDFLPCGQVWAFCLCHPNSKFYQIQTEVVDRAI